MSESRLNTAVTAPTAETLIAQTAAHVRAQMEGEGSGHDWWHVERVWNNARTIAADEDVNATVVELAVLLHDVADWKFNGGDLTAAPRAAREWLQGLGADERLVEQVCYIVERVSFKGAGVADQMDSKEGRVVQDADRLDAMGAIGIARAFAYGGHAGRPLHDPDSIAELHRDPAAYHASRSGTLNHFYEKLLLLAERMHTATGKRLAIERHKYMEGFVERFLAEWQGQA